MGARASKRKIIYLTLHTYSTPTMWNQLKGLGTSVDIKGMLRVDYVEVDVINQVRAYLCDYNRQSVVIKCKWHKVVKDEL